MEGALHGARVGKVDWDQRRAGRADVVKARKRPSVRLMGVLVPVLCGLGWAFAQEEAPGFPEVPVIRAGGLSVVVDAVVTDSRNAVVTDLRAEEFRVYEDGVEQPIDSVVLVRSGVGSTRLTPAEGGAAPGREAEGQVAEAAPINWIVFLLDFATTEYVNQKLVVDAAIRYVEENLRPEDYVAVFGLGAGFGLIQDFTNDRGRLIAALQLRDVGGRSMGARAAAGPEVPQFSSEVVSDAGAATVSAGSPQEMAAAGEETSRERSELARLALGLRIQKAFFSMGSFVQEREARGVLTAIRAIAQGLENLEGRKTLILFSQGFVVGPYVEQALQKTISAANRANLAVYAVDSRGLETKDAAPGEELYSIGATQGSGSIFGGRRIDATGGQSLFDRAKQVGSDARDSALRFIAAETGGFAVRNTNDLHLALERIDADLRSYYLITYRPQRQELDGTYRQIQVEVLRPDCTVRHRSGYLAVPAGLELLSPEEYRLLRQAEAGALALDLPAFLRLDTFRRPGDVQPVVASIEILREGLEIREVSLETGRAHEVSLEVLGLVQDGSGSAVMKFGGPRTFRLTDEELQAISQGGLRFNTLFQLPPGTYAVKLLIHDRYGGRAALVEQSLRVDPPRTASALSSIVLGKEVRRTPGAEILCANDVSVVPSAQRAFRNGENLVFFFEYYNPPAGVGELEVFLNRPGAAKRIRVAQLPVSAAGNDRLAFARFVPLEGLPAGTYFLEVAEPAGGAPRILGRTSFQLLE
ncbi:MAG: hypothetical protein Kow00109_08530 [Acidobacteriota bacterium]